MKVTTQAKDFINGSELSYRNIIKNLDSKFNIRLSKSAISYYKRSKDRLIKLNIDKINQIDMDWLNGFFMADGCKFIERKYSYVIKFALDATRDKEILEKLSRILNLLGCKFSILNENNTVVVRIFSKMLFSILPTKNKPFVPINVNSFLAGLVDGDGCKKSNSAVLVQYENTPIMEYLSKVFGLKASVSKVRTPYGNSTRRQYYIPKHVCDEIRHLSVKLNR